MTNIKNIILAILVLTYCTVNASQITVKILDNKTKVTPVVYTPYGDNIPVTLDKTGNGSVTVDNKTDMYVEIGYNGSSRLLWLSPGSTLEISFNSGEFNEKVKITGTNKEINTFLNSDSYSATQINDAGLSEDKFLHKADSMMQANLLKLKNGNFPESFNKQEAVRLKYYTYYALPIYPIFHSRIAKDTTFKASPKYWDKLNEIAVYDNTLLQYDEYKTLISEAVTRLAEKEFPGLKGIERLSTYIDKKVSDPKIGEYLINRSVYAYIERNGLANTGQHFAAFKKYVSDEKMINKMNLLQEKWEKVSPGSPSSDFNAVDINGKKVALADLKGDYLYIDIWATWCGPCKKEIPYLAELEEKYHGKGIKFISISCDSNKAAWEKQVKSGTMKGIQLHFNSSSTFMDDYMIMGIPRFILLDREGRIISSDMTRPSDPATASAIEELIKS